MKIDVLLLDSNILRKLRFLTASPWVILETCGGLCEIVVDVLVFKQGFNLWTLKDFRTLD
jgi:hypothetical protein